MKTFKDGRDIPKPYEDYCIDKYLDELIDCKIKTIEENAIAVIKVRDRIFRHPSFYNKLHNISKALPNNKYIAIPKDMDLSFYDLRTLNSDLGFYHKSQLKFSIIYWLRRLTLFIAKKNCERGYGFFWPFR